MKYLEKLAESVGIAASPAERLAIVVLALGVVILSQELDCLAELLVCGVELGVRDFELVVSVCEG